MGYSDSILVNGERKRDLQMYATGNHSPNIRIINKSGVQKQRNGGFLGYMENMTCANTGKYSGYAKEHLKRRRVKI
ncbi:hypothetical protein DPMN_081644 [Dreissena polymorpha]|uniref:Uncharacterized protein n=1 Tax=Dreissena polymorpha TaxID=45954 RepID=A0A9D3Y9E0_DREPO|nr:hypothetical protein DPMN_081644 [Dreissena polymorpha]